ncbi:MAG: DUF1206 domain-containing protein [Nocardioidaceae bacterium]
MSNMTGNTAGGVGHHAEGAARQIQDNVWFERGIRVGLAAYGIIHILVGWLALQLAFGDSSGAPDQQGALQQVAQQSYGEPLLWVIGIGLFILAIWQLFEAIWGHRSRDEPKRTIKRIGSAGKVVLYTVIGISALKTALDANSGGRSSEDKWTAKLMQQSAGQWLVAAVGLIIIVLAFMQAKRGVTKSFEKDLQAAATSGESGSAVVKLGQVGYVSKGVALAVIGGLFVWAAWNHDPKKAGGLDVALRTLLDQSVGPWLLALVAAGIVCFGLYCFAWARYADTNS